MSSHPIQIPSVGSPPYRIAVVGCPGSGKTTLAKRLSEALKIEHVEFDALYHGPNWEPTPLADFQAQLHQLTSTADQWVTCGNYGNSGGADVRERANRIVFLELPWRVVMSRIIKRSFGRAFTRKELWNGNRERISSLLHPSPDKNIVLCAFVQHPRYRRQYRAAIADKHWSHAQVIHLKSAKAVNEFCESLPSAKQ